MVAIDHLAVGDSSIPPAEHAKISDVAAADHAAILEIVRRLKNGSITGRCISPGAIIGLGQSMGGFIVVTMQAKYRTFNAMAVLGASMVRTRLPSRHRREALHFSAGLDPGEAKTKTFAETDWQFVFHWEDVPPWSIPPPHCGLAGAPPQNEKYSTKIKFADAVPNVLI